MSKKNAKQNKNTNAAKKSSQGNQPRKNRGPKGPRRSMQDQMARNPPRTAVAAAYATGTHQMAPRRYRTKDGEGVVHKEFIGNISGVGSTAFTQTFSIPLNPGLFQSFPWLSFIANNYESYRFNSLRFCYYTRTGSNVAGSVLIVPDYDSADSAPGTEQVATTYNDAQEDAPWKDICCILSKGAMNNLGPHKFVRNGGTVGDIKTYDSGNLFVFTVDSAAAAPWGKLWVEYDCEFFTPQLNPNGNVQSAQVVGNTVASLAGNIIFGTTPIISFSSSNIFSIAPGTNVITFLQNYSGDYMAQVIGTVLSAPQSLGTATLTNVTTLTNAGATQTIFNGTIVALTGQTLILSETATTVTSSRLTLSQSLF